MSQFNDDHDAWATHLAPPASPKSSTPATAIVILGAGGDLAKKKTYPALLLLYRCVLCPPSAALPPLEPLASDGSLTPLLLCRRGMLPPATRIWGIDRLEMDTAAFREKMTDHGFLAKAAAGDDASVMEGFMSMLFYAKAQVDSKDDFARLSAEIRSWQPCTNRMFYLALPPSVFAFAAASIKAQCMGEAPTEWEGAKPWTRVIVEKPFGHDLASSDALQAKLGKLLKEEQIYRIDHYLGKEMVQNLSVVRFANAMFEPMWNRHHIASVAVTFKEDITVEGRAGYFDQIGLIRDVMQNHLLQLVTLVAMEPPTTINAEDIRNKKVEVLRAMKPLTLDDVVLGQYEGYTFEDDVPNGSTTETYAQAVFKIENSRWRGVPFIVKCAKAVNERKCEIRVQFEESPLPYYRDECGECKQVLCTDSCTTRQGANRNEMVIRVQPDEAMYMKTNMKRVGEEGVVTAELDLSYSKRFPGAYVPEAYERLIDDCLNGKHANFVRDDELRESWILFDGLMREIAEKKPVPLIYKRGSRGPVAADEKLTQLGVRRTHAYSGPAWKKMRASSSLEGLDRQLSNDSGSVISDSSSVDGARQARVRAMSAAGAPEATPPPL